MTNEPNDDRDNNDWSLWWDARMAAMESILGPSGDKVLHAVVPFDCGYDIGGRADVVYFREHLPGVGYATSELIGRDDQIPNILGNYELLIFHREDNDWGPEIISSLAYYTCEAALEPGHTMDLGPAAPEGSSLAAFLFLDYGRFVVRQREAGLLLCLGITSEELAVCRTGNRKKVEAALKSSGVFPYTDLFRASVIET